MHALCVQIARHGFVVAGDYRELDNTIRFSLFLVLDPLTSLQDKIVLVTRAEVILLTSVILVYVWKERAVSDRCFDAVVKSSRKVVSGAVSHNSSLRTLRRGCSLPEN